MKDSFTTFRRYYLDRFLESISFSGDVLDIGGKKENKRGKFCPPLDDVETWRYVNTDADCKPDFLCSAEAVPVPDETCDWILLCEVIEHLESPDAVLDECVRLLKPGGRFVITAPFLFGVHADPMDFTRWTGDRYRLELEKRRGMTMERIEPMGGIWAVIWDMFHVLTSPGGPERWKRCVRRLFRCLLPLFRRLDRRMPGRDKITSGYAMIAVK